MLNTVKGFESALTLSLPVTSVNNLGKQFGPKSGPTIDQVQTGWHSDGVPKRFFLKLILKKQKKNKISRRHKNTRNYPAFNVLMKVLMISFG